MSETVAIDLAGLMGRLNTQAVSCLEEAGGWAFNRGNYEVIPAHLFSKMIEDRASDLPPILSHYEVDSGRLLRLIEDSLERLKTGSGGELSYSPALVQLFTDAWLLSSVDFKQNRVRSSVLLLAALLSPGKYLSVEVHQMLGKISVDKLREQISNSDLDSEEEAAAGAAGGAAAAGTAGSTATGDFLDRFTVDFTKLARDGGIDPVFGRDREIRQMLDILGRRRKNNPIVVGEAGVGKTAVVEGLALRIVQDDIPDFLKGVRLLSLDMGLLQAGASVKGEFEKRLQGVIEDGFTHTDCHVHRRSTHLDRCGRSSGWRRRGQLAQASPCPW
jgi:type VI secretion system protein VasG